MRERVLKIELEYDSAKRLNEMGLNAFEELVMATIRAHQEERNGDQFDLVVHIKNIT